MLSHLHPFWRGHLFLFDKPNTGWQDSSTGVKVLLIFLVMEGLVRPVLLFGSRSLHLTGQTWWMLCYVVLITLAAFWSVRILTDLRRDQLGLYPWRQWSQTEKLYFLQVIPIGIVVFSFFSMGKLQLLWTRPNLLEISAAVFLPEMIWGFYQEVVYRGLLQTELVRRWGSFRGILVSNLIFTFGPLHAYHFTEGLKHPAHLWIFAAIFAIGLLFSILFRRSGNLWIVGIMHGLGDMFIVGLSRI